MDILLREQGVYDVRAKRFVYFVYAVTTVIWGWGHNHNIVINMEADADIEYVKSVLPQEQTTIIIGKEESMGSDGFPIITWKFFTNIKTQDEFKEWLKEFENITGTSYTILCTDNNNPNGQKVTFKQRLRCCHSTRCARTYVDSVKGKTRNTNCPSKILVTIHTIRKYRGKYTQKFYFINSMPCEIKLTVSHNHDIGTTDSLRFRKVSDTVKEQLIDLFRNGHTAATALEIIRFGIQLKSEDCVKDLADRNLCPDYSYSYHLYTKNFKLKQNLENNATEEIHFLEAKIAKYNSDKNDNCVKVVFDGTNSKEYVIGVSTPLMKRVHTNIEAASQVVFMASSGSSDKKRRRLYAMLTYSECGALPLGLFITTSDTVTAIKTGFNILKDLLGGSIFGGHTEGPKIFVIEDSLAEQTAVSETWPSASRFLSSFHVLQAVSRWLSKSKNCIPKEEQVTIFRDFENILYAKNLNEMKEKYDIAVENSSNIENLNYVDYLYNSWWKKREDWVLAYRNNLIMKKNYSNGYSDNAIRELNDKIFPRLKSFNTVQMVDFVLTKFEEFYETKLLDAASNKLKTNYLPKNTKMPPEEICSHIKQLSETIIAIPCETNPEIMYFVNAEYLTCSCPEGITGSICMHIDWANMLFYNENHTIKIDNARVRQNFFFVATGREDTENRSGPLAEPNEMEANDVGNNKDVKIEHNESFLEMDTEINIGDCERENNINVILDKVTEKIKLAYEKSPYEILESTRKMLGNLEKLKTLAKVSAAMASFGLEESEDICEETSVKKRKLSGKRKTMETVLEGKESEKNDDERTLMSAESQNPVLMCVINQVLMCAQCNIGFITEKCLYDHMMKMHYKTMKQCPVCLTYFPTIDFLKDHLASKHVGLETRCKTCNKTIELLSELNSHHLCSSQKQHKFCCQICQLDFKLAAEFDDHTKEVHKQVEFICE